MEHLPDYYTTLFNAVTDGLTALQENKPALAQQILIAGQQKAEADFLAVPPVSRTQQTKNRP